MGHEIVYCARCANKIAGVKAVHVGSQVLCPQCAPAVTPSPAAEPDPLRSSTKMKPAKPSAPRPVAASRTPIYAAAGVGVILLIAAVVFLRPTAPPPAEPVAARPSEPPKPAAAEEKKDDPLLRDARAAIDAARAMTKAPLEEQITAWEEAARKAALTTLFKEASAGLQEARGRRPVVKPVETEKPVVVAPTEKLPSPDVKAYQSRFEAAMAKAAVREFEAAIADLGRAAAELTDEDVRRDARSDAEDLQRARVLLAEAQAALAQVPKGKAIALETRGGRKRIEGTVLRAGTAWLELSTGYVEIEDVSAASLAALTGKSGPGLALLSVLDGEAEAAGSLPPRYADYVRAAKPPKPSSRDLEIRERFYAAEREFGKMETLAAAVAKYRSLLEDAADSRVVKSERIRIQRRAEAGKEYVLLPHVLKGTGTFALSQAGKMDAAWMSKADIEGAQAIENYVEAEFAALPELTYRCWVLAGGCCAETFTFYLQSTEATELNTKTRQRVPIDPGAAMAATVRPSISGLKKTHEEHKIKGSKTHPKTPARWEWVAIVLPKYSGPGPKKLRFLSDQQGFSIGAVLVSATRQGPLTEAELKEELSRAAAQAAEEGRTLLAPPVTGLPWRPVFDGKSLDCLRSNGDGWHLENGAISHNAGPGNAAQTREEFEDVELRIRFELRDLENAYFKLKQGGGGGYAILIDGAIIKTFEGKPHELIFLAKGEQVTATLDGKPANVIVEGVAKRGCLQFNGNGKTLNLLSIDAR